MPVASSPTFRDIFTSLEVLSHGSLGLTRAVRRNSDGLVLARKELHYEPMTDNDRKLLASELNANRDLFHEHVVRYYDHHIGEHEGTPEILMEYFGTENLATVIKRASAEGRPIPEGTVWNYFMQILSALHYCHFPGEVNARAVKGGKDAMRTQVLHRDLKPDNVLLGDANHIKLCDFGLSKALEQVTFMSTRIGTSHYMAPELIEHKRYSTQSDIWALGCLVYEMCALKSPFAEARTQSELSAAIQSGDIPPLPAVYSPDMWAVIKSMLSVNPASRPSAAELLKNEHIKFVSKVSETDRMLATVKAHKLALLSREAELRAREARLAVILSSKDTSIHDLRAREKALADENAALGRAIEQQSTRIEERSTLMHELSEHQRTLQSEHEASLAKLITHVNSARAAREAEIEQAWAARELEISQEMVALFDGRARLAAEMRRLAEEFEGTDVAAVERGDVKDVESLARIVQALESPGVPVSVTRSRSRTLPRHLRPTAETPLRQQTGSTPAGARNSAALMAAAATITPAELELVCDGLPTSSSRGTWSRRSRIHRSASTGGARTAQSKTSTLTRRQMSEWSAHTDASALTAAPSDLFSSTSTFPEWSAEAMLAQLGKGYGDARAYGGI